MRPTEVSALAVTTTQTTSEISFFIEGERLQRANAYVQWRSACTPTAKEMFLRIFFFSCQTIHTASEVELCAMCTLNVSAEHLPTHNNSRFFSQ